MPPSFGDGRPPLGHVEPRGPPKTRPLVPKKLHRRAPHACDECRLRKRACDNAQPCGPCRRSGTGCSYQFRRPVSRPTSRIRTLQDHLRQARGWLQQVKEKTSGVPGLDLDECLRTLDFTVPDHVSPSPSPSQPPASSGHGSRRRRNVDMLTGCDRFVRRDAGVECYYGPYSDVSFILRTIELLDRGPTASQDHQLCIISDLLGRPLQYGNGIANWRQASFELPEDALDVLNAVFSRGDLMMRFLPEQQLINAVVDLPTTPIPDNLLPVLHLALALGYLYNTKLHRTRSCGDALELATNHFCLGMDLTMLSHTQTLTSLQATLCAVSFHLSSHRCTTAHPLLGSACSSALRLGLLSATHKAPETTADERRMRTRLVASVLSYDALQSLSLDLPTFIHRDQIPRRRLVELAVEAEAEGDLVTAALLRQSCLLAIPLNTRSQGPQEATGIDPSEPDDLGPLQSAYEDCQRWKRDTASLMTRLGLSSQFYGVRADLEMTYNLAQIILFRPHLHYLRDMYAGKTISVAESHYALACIKVASSTVVRAEELQDQSPLPYTHSWLTIYTVFSSAMSLAFLVAAHPATTLPSIAWQRACRGIKIIAAHKCTDDLPEICLQLLKMITHALSDTIHIDFEKIEASTVRNCGEVVQASSSEMAELALDYQYLDQELHGTRPPASVADGGKLERSDGNWGTFDMELENEADRVLEQAEALPVGFDLEDLLRISDSE